MGEGYIPYVITNFASTCGREPLLQHLDMSLPGRDNIPFLGFEPAHRDVLSSGIGHGFMYYSVFPGSTFPMHCEQGGLGAFNAIVGVLGGLVTRALGEEGAPKIEDPKQQEVAPGGRPAKDKASKVAAHTRP